MMPRNLRLTTEGWEQLMAKFDLDSLCNTHSALINSYSEEHRAYHTLDHIDACFRHLDTVAEQAEHPHEIELALWFHDVVYEPFSGSNEEDSAAMAKQFLTENNIDVACVDRIYDLIILTKDHRSPATVDAKIMLDVDLSILGSSPVIYAQFEKDVRQEYQQVPWSTFREKRKEILQSFLDRPRLYHTPYVFDRLER